MDQGASKEAQRGVEQPMASGFNAARRARGGPALTARETEIAQLASRGLRNLEIASLCRCSAYTVRNHLAAIFRKLDVSTRAELAMLVAEAVLTGRPLPSAGVRGERAAAPPATGR